MDRRNNPIYEFGLFRLDPAEHSLRRDGERVRLEPRLFETLLALVEQSGHLVEKEELVKRVWPGVIVGEGSLARNIYDLRKVLGDDPKKPRYIETIPRVGYRFIASVTVLQLDQFEAEARPNARGDPGVEAASAILGSEPVAALGAAHYVAQTRRPRRWMLAMVLAVALLGGVGFLIYLLASERPRPISTPSLVPFTSFPGAENSPALSPDGQQAAFVWDGEAGDNFDIYLKSLAAEAPRRLTAHPDRDDDPVWSPDGRQIAFLRRSAERIAFYVMPASGGAEREVAEAFPHRPEAWGGSVDWSPDGKLLAIVDKLSPGEPFAIFLLSLESGERRRLTSPPAECVGDNGPAFSPDGSQLAFARICSNAVYDLYLAPVAGGEARRITFDQQAIGGLDWTADGGEIVFSSNRKGSFSLWRIAVAGGEPQPLTPSGDNAFRVSISRRGQRLVYAQEIEDTNIWRVAGPLAADRSVAPALFISSTRREDAPRYSPDGQRIAFHSDRSGSYELWICDSEGKHAAQLTNFGGPHVGCPRWSPDGRQIAFDSTAAGNRDIYVINADGSGLRRITTNATAEARPSWSRDGQWIYFASRISGDWQVWRMPAAGGAALQVTRRGGREACESSDGRFVYYAKSADGKWSSDGDWSVWRTLVSGGEEIPVLDHVRQGYWALLDQGICFLSPELTIEFFSFATRRLTRLATAARNTDWSGPGFTVSPDGRWALYLQLDRNGNDIMLADYFR